MNLPEAKPLVLDEYRARLERNPNAANHYLYGRLLNGSAAMREYREAMRLDPKQNWARVALGHALLEAEQDEEAFAALKESLQSGELIESAPVTLAIAAVATKRIAEAVELLKQHVEPEKAWEASWLLARASEDWDQAKFLLTQREDGQPTTDTTIMRARLEWEAGGTRPSILA
ncbi:MAG TPA: hypothetical protein VF608_15490, partial [Thermoanaerobaculia bacterium]